VITISHANAGEKQYLKTLCDTPIDHLNIEFTSKEAIINQNEKEKIFNATLYNVKSASPNYIGYLEIIEFNTELAGQISMSHLQKMSMPQKKWTSRNDISIQGELLTAPSFTPPIMLFRKGEAKTDDFRITNVQTIFMLTNKCHAIFDILIGHAQGENDLVIEKYFQQLRTHLRKNSQNKLLHVSSPPSLMRTIIAMGFGFTIILLIIGIFFLIQRKKNKKSG
jgi:hypothetical protein